jgi:hypothetical protein
MLRNEITCAYTRALVKLNVYRVSRSFAHLVFLMYTFSLSETESIFERKFQLGSPLLIATVSLLGRQSQWGQPDMPRLQPFDNAGRPQHHSTHAGHPHRPASPSSLY